MLVKDYHGVVEKGKQGSIVRRTGHVTLDVNVTSFL